MVYLYKNEKAKYKKNISAQIQTANLLITK